MLSSFFKVLFNHFFVPIFLFLNFILKLSSTSLKILNEMYLLGNWLLLSLHTFLSLNLGSPLHTTLLLSQQVLCSVGHVPVTTSGCQSLVEDVLHDFTLPSFTEFADS